MKFSTLLSLTSALALAAVPFVAGDAAAQANKKIKIGFVTTLSGPNAAIGVDMVKVDATITDEQLVAIIDEAKKFELPVLGHLRDIDFAMTHGMKEMEHLAPFWRAQLARQGEPLPPAGSDEGEELMARVDTTRFGPLIQRMVEQEVIVDIALYGWIPREVWRAARPEIERLANVLYVGRPAFGQPGTQATIFRLEPDSNLAQRVPVKLGRASVSLIEIEQGLKQGDRVILSDTSQWDEYDRIKLN